MTVATTNSKSGPYAGAGSTGPFTVDFRFLENAHLLVVKTMPGGDDVVLVLDSDYSVTGAGAEQGAVTLAAPLAVSEKLTIVRNVPITQEADYVQNDSFPAQSHEDALDKLTMVAQQIAEGNGRTLKLSVSTPSDVSSTLQPPLPSHLIGWDAAGKKLENMSPSTIATIVAFGTANADIYTGDGVKTAFDLTAHPGAQANLDVSVGGVTQLPGVDYTWSGGVRVNFVAPPPLGAKILLRYFRGLPQGFTDSDAAYFMQAGAGATERTMQSKGRESVSVKDFGAEGLGISNETSSFAKARTASGGAYLIPSGTYIVDEGFNVFGDPFTAGPNVTLIVGGVSYNASNAFAGALRYRTDSPVLTSIVHAATGEVLMQFQNGMGGTATYFYRGLSIQTDSHWLQAGPKTALGSCDELIQRSALHPTDPGGNRFNKTFETGDDRLLRNYATTASGFPSFDSYMRVWAGTNARMDFPALQPTFRQGWAVQNRAETGFKLVMTPGTDRHHIETADGSKRFQTFKSDGAQGFFGAGGDVQRTITGSRGGNAALASLLTALAAYGLISDGTTT